jgi:predicted  nucleic acid-binding Zn-ribbon protein
MEMQFRTYLIIILLVAVAFGVGYGWQNMKLRNAEKEWAAAKAEMQTKISTLEKELAQVKARESLWEMPLALSQVGIHLSEKNFGLATQALDQLKEIFAKAQAALNDEWKKKVEFFLPALEEIRNEAQNMDPSAKKKIEELENLFKQALWSSKTG